MTQALCPECGSPLPAGAAAGSCSTCLLMLGVEAHAVEITPVDPEAPAPGQPPGDSTRTEQSGQRIGRYKLLEQIGEGGFGTVWMAEQQEPVRRKVALKIIKLGMDTKQVVARFEAERQALAMMDHPNIARVFDGGATENGRPYFVMELVRGIPLTTYCDTARLATRERLELFIYVCQAVQHGHQKGIIHRDLKPTNILVTEQDGRTIPKVIDFGIAKATEQKLTELTLFTRFNQMLGTPAYMSPEQAGLGSLDIDTRSDIYSLGVLLYELLTGQTPLDPQKLREAGYDAILKTIREVEPPKPSTCLTQDLVADDVRRRTSLPPDESASSRRRLQEKKELIRLVRGDLDWIALKALEKDRVRRYQTANALTVDLQRHLQNEVVEARPPSAVYHFQKWIRRHKSVFAAGVAVATALLLGLGASIWQAARAKFNASETRRELYVAWIRLAHQAWQEGNLEQADKMLEAAISSAEQEDLRDFEWRYLRKLVRDESRLTFTNVYFKITGWGIPTAGGGLAIDGQTLIVGSSNTIKWLDLENKREVRTLNLGSNVIWPWAVAMKRPGLLAYYSDSIKTISPRGEPLLIDGLIHKSCRALAWSWDGELLASADPWSMKVVKLWDAKTGAQMGDDLHLGSGIASLAFSPDAKYLVCGDMESKIQVFEAKTSKRVAELTNHTAIAHRLVFDATGTKLVSGSHDSHIQVWSFPDCTPLARLSGHKGDVADVAFSPDGLWLTSGGTDHTLRLWDLTTPGKFTLLRGHRGGVLSVLFSQDGKEPYSGSDDGTVKVWPLTFAESTNLLRHSQWLNDVAFSPEGTLLAVADHYARSTILWDLPTRTRIGQFQHTTNSIGLSIAFSPDGKFLAAAGQDTVAQVWNVSERKMIWEFPKAKGGGDPTIAIHPSKPILAVAWKDVRFWNLQNGSQIHLLTEPLDQHVQSVAFSPNGKWIALGMRSGRVYLWNLISGQQSQVFEEHSDSVLALRFSHDSNLLVSGSKDNRIALYDLPRMQAVAHLDGHTRFVLGLAFTPDDKSLVSASWDGTARFWCVANRDLALTLAHDGGPISAVAFSPDGNLMATIGSDGTARLWPAVSREEMASTRPRQSVR